MPEGRLTIGRRLPTCPTKSSRRAKKGTDSSKKSSRLNGLTPAFRALGAARVSAGGMFAAWEVGVWKVLREHFTPDLIVGASAGAWNGWAVAGGATAEELVRDWLDPITATLRPAGFRSAGLPLL